MSKKNKKNKYDAIDEMEFADMLAKYERGECSFEDVFGNNNTGNDKSIDIESLIVNAINKEPKPVEEIAVDTTATLSVGGDSEGSDITVAESPVPITEEKVSYPASIEKTEPGINIDYNYNIAKLIINDGLCPFTVGIKSSSALVLNKNAEMIDDDHLCSILTILFHYIIAHLHPFCIITDKEYSKYFNKYANINVRKFIVISIDGYKFLYYISNDAFDLFMSIPATYNMSAVETLKFYISTAYCAARIDNTFNLHDDAYVNEIYSMRRNNLSEYIELIENDDETIITDNPKESIVDRLDIDYDFIHNDAIQDITLLTQDTASVTFADDDTDDDTDDDDEDDDINYSEFTRINEGADDPNVDISVEDFTDGEAPEIEISDDNDDGETDNTENLHNNTSQDESMIISPIRKK
jgi:hypothetical protein